MKDKLRAFTFGQLQDFVTLYEQLQREGLSLEDLSQYVKEERARLDEHSSRSLALREKLQARTPRCEKCATIMVLRPADTEVPSEGSHWTCPKCRWGFFVDKSTAQIMEELNNGLSV